MKLKQNPKLVQNLISEVEKEHSFVAQPPNPPTPEAIKKAQFKDKTYRWNGR